MENTHVDGRSAEVIKAVLMSYEKATMTVLFADICQSTRLFETCGDIRAREIVSRTLAPLMAITRARGGCVVKTIGDEIMCTFPDPEAAVVSACEMQHAVHKDSALAPWPIAIRIGFHQGDVLQENGDVFGDAVNLASRMVDIAKADQIITTGRTARGVSQDACGGRRDLGRMRVRGKSEPLEIIEILWHDDISVITVLNRPPLNKEILSFAKLVLRHRDLKIEVLETDPPFTMGRGDHNRLHIDDPSVSRQHAVIEYRKNRYTLIDRSTNGTYVRMNETDPIFLHREELYLHGQGVISLGQEIEADHPELIRFKCRQ
ncbi:MAG: adenylate/guanylate cyclase domain-containing protein [Thermodesulfobacteriota bacterium]